MTKSYPKKGNDISGFLFSSLEFLDEFTNQASEDISSTNKKLIWYIVNIEFLKGT